MATDYAGLIPDTVASEIIRAARHQSAAMSLGRTVRMPKGASNLPVISAVPQAGFVAGRGGHKPVSVVEWSTEKIVPEELACIIAIPDDFIDDNSFPVWDEVQPLVTDAIAYAFDMAALWGVGAPASFPAGGVAAFAGVVVQEATPLLAISEAMGQVEDSLLTPTGHATGPGSGRTLRTLKDENGNLVYLPAVTQGEPGTLYGLPINKTAAWDDLQGDLITGDWTKLVIGIRQDIRIDFSNQAVLTDDDGVVVANAFQDDLTIMRAYVRTGAAIGVPVNVRGDLTDPFAIATFTPTGGVPAGSTRVKPAAGRASKAKADQGDEE